MHATRPQGPSSPPLTARQAAIYRFVFDSARRHGYQPTVREIGAAFGITSPNGVLCTLRALEQKGWTARRAGRWRGVQLLRWPTGEPFLGFDRPPES